MAVVVMDPWTLDKNANQCSNHCQGEHNRAYEDDFAVTSSEWTRTVIVAAVASNDSSGGSLIHSFQWVGGFLPVRSYRSLDHFLLICVGGLI